MNEIKEQKTQERVLWVDYAKLITIFLVVFDHLNLRNERLAFTIDAFHMQCFFMLSGIGQRISNDKHGFINNGGGGYKHIVETLLIPYLFFYILCYPYWFLKTYFIKHIEFNFTNYLFKPLAGALLGVVEDTNYSYMVMGSLWFLMALFFIRIIFTLVSDKSTVFHFYISIILAVIGVILNRFKVILPFSLSVVCLNFLFYEFGYWAKPVIDKLISLRIFEKVSVCIMLILMLFSLAGLNGKFHVCDAAYGNNIFIFYINAIIGSLLVFMLASFIVVPSRFLLFFAQNTLIIMALQTYAFSPFKLFYTRHYSIPADCQNYMPAGYALLITIISVLILSIPIYILNRFCPVLIGKKRKLKEK